MKAPDLNLKDLTPEQRKVITTYAKPLLPCKCGAPPQAPMGAHRPDCNRSLERALDDRGEPGSGPDDAS